MHREDLEFSRVLIFDAEETTSAERERLRLLDAADRADAELRRRSLTYVASTRARDQPVVIGT